LDHLAAGRISERTYVWRDGQADWKRAEEVPERADQLQVVAPPPPAPVSEPAPAAAEAPARQAASSQPAPLLDEPEAEKQPVAAKQPAAAPASSDLDQMLFAGEFENHPTLTSRPLDAAAMVAGDLEKSASAAPRADPFALVPDNPNMSKPMEIGEQTRFFMKQAGVTRRNPPWKIALAVLLMVGGPVGVLYALSTMKLVNLEITQVDESGHEVSTPVFSAQGMSGLRNMLLGKNKAPAANAKSQNRPRVAGTSPAKPATPAVPAKPADGEGAIVAKADISFNTMSDADRAKLKGLYSEGHGLDKPKVDAKLLEKPISVDGQAGLEPKVISEVIGKNLKAFQVCTETELRRNPTFKGGKIKITVTIGSSGVVTSAVIDRQEINGSDLGQCLRDKAKRVVFPRFEGEPFDVEIPLVLTGGA
jgi:hypothetical protein